jgi:hypothetical protein
MWSSARGSDQSSNSWPVSMRLTLSTGGTDFSVIRDANRFFAGFVKALRLLMDGDSCCG